MGEYNCSLLNSGGGREAQNQQKNQGQTALYTQLVISIALGAGAFITFCVRDPGLSRWIPAFGSD